MALTPPYQIKASIDDLVRTDSERQRLLIKLALSGPSLVYTTTVGELVDSVIAYDEYQFTRFRWVQSSRQITISTNIATPRDIYSDDYSLFLFSDDQLTEIKEDWITTQSGGHLTFVIPNTETAARSHFESLAENDVVLLANGLPKAIIKIGPLRIFIRMFKNLLPRSRLFVAESKIYKAIDRFITAFAIEMAHIRQTGDSLFTNLDPLQTTKIQEWENQHGLIPYESQTEAQRRTAIATAWKATGGQSPHYIQSILRSADFDVYVHDYWDTPLTNPPTVRDPRTHLNDAPLQIESQDGHMNMAMGNAFAQDGNSSSPRMAIGHLLTNNIPRRNMNALGHSNHELTRMFINVGDLTNGYLYNSQDANNIIGQFLGNDPRLTHDPDLTINAIRWQTSTSQFSIETAEDGAGTFFDTNELSVFILNVANDILIELTNAFATAAGFTEQRTQAWTVPASASDTLSFLNNIQENNQILIVISPTGTITKFEEISAVVNDWKNFFYIGGETFPAVANVPSSRQEEFETLVLRLKPAEKWVGLLVDYQ